MSIVPLIWATFRYFRMSNLSGVHLEGANLRKAILWNANLSNAHLEGTNLVEADLQGGTDHEEAYLGGANLSRANLTRAKITQKQLKQAGSLKGATMPDWSVHP